MTTELLEPPVTETRERNDFKVLADLDTTPASYVYECPYCHETGTTAGIRGFKAASKMICDDCATAYHRKLGGSLELNEHERGAAFAVARIDRDSIERKGTISRWTRNTQPDMPSRVRVKYAKMLELVAKCDRGLADIPTQPKRSKFQQ